MIRKIQHIALLLVLPLLASAQILPSNFTEETAPDNDNFEVYSQKSGLSRRASLLNLKKYFDQNLTFSGDTLFLSSADVPDTIFLGAFDESLALTVDNLIMGDDTVSLAAYKDSIYYEPINNRICLIAGSCATLPSDTTITVVNNTGAGQEILKSFASDTATLRELIQGDNISMEKDLNDNIEINVSLFVEPSNATDTVILDLSRKLNFKEIDGDFNFAGYDTIQVNIGTDNTSDTYSRIVFNDIADSLLLTWESRVVTGTGSQLGSVVVRGPTTFSLLYDASADVYYADVIYSKSQTLYDVAAEDRDEHHNKAIVTPDSIIVTGPSDFGWLSAFGTTTGDNFTTTGFVLTDSTAVWQGANGTRFMATYHTRLRLHGFDISSPGNELCETHIVVNSATYASSRDYFYSNAGGSDLAGEEYLKFSGTTIVTLNTGDAVGVRAGGFTGGIMPQSGSLTLIQIDQ